MISDDLLESLQIYLGSDIRTHSRFFSDPRGRRKGAIRDDPIMVIMHQRLLPVAEMLLETQLRRAHCLTVIYDGTGAIAKRTDKPYEFNLDLCIRDTGPETSWRRAGEDAGYLLKPGQGIIHAGPEQERRRELSLQPGQEVIMAFFHFLLRVQPSATTDRTQSPYETTPRQAAAAT